MACGKRSRLTNLREFQIEPQSQSYPIGSAVSSLVGVLPLGGDRLKEENNTAKREKQLSCL